MSFQMPALQYESTHEHDFWKVQLNFFFIPTRSHCCKQMSKISVVEQRTCKMNVHAKREKKKNVIRLKL